MQCTVYAASYHKVIYLSIQYQSSIYSFTALQKYTAAISMATSKLKTSLRSIRFMPLLHIQLYAFNYIVADHHSVNVILP